MKFAEPGGDADFLVGTTNGFWDSLSGTPTIVTDFVHTPHIKSIKYAPNITQVCKTVAGSIADTGTRISFYVYFNVLPTTGDSSICRLFKSDGTTNVAAIRVSTGGVIKLYATAQIGTNGATLSAGVWYRISLAYTITSTTINRFELFVNGVSSISITNATLVNTVTSLVGIGNLGPDTGMDLRSSDHYIDDSNSLTDPGNIWVTAKRPNANGTANNFVTQIGAGGSGYGTGHSPQVNERPLSITNGWSVVAVGATTEEYNIESTNIGDMNIAGKTIIDYVGWVSSSALIGETVQVIVNGVNFAQAITSTNTMYKKIAGSTVYPTGTGADIGMTTDATATTVSLFECGIVVAFLGPPTTNNLTLLGVS